VTSPPALGRAEFGAHILAHADCLFHDVSPCLW
jgi:hypothetical protein